MIKVTNISKRSVVIGGVAIKSLKSYIFPDNMPDDIMEDINSLSNLGFIRVTAIEEVNNAAVGETTTTRKSNKKNK